MEDYLRFWIRKKGKEVRQFSSRQNASQPAHSFFHCFWPSQPTRKRADRPTSKAEIPRPPRIMKVPTKCIGAPTMPTHGIRSIGSRSPGFGFWRRLQKCIVQRCYAKQASSANLRLNLAPTESQCLKAPPSPLRTELAILTVLRCVFMPDTSSVEVLQPRIQVFLRSSTQWYKSSPHQKRLWREMRFQGRIRRQGNAS
jgi:hypothetical protein